MLGYCMGKFLGVCQKRKEVSEATGRRRKALTCDKDTGSCLKLIGYDVALAFTAKNLVEASGGLEVLHSKMRCEDRE